MKNLASIPFFISLLTLLSGIIQIDGALVESKAVAKKLGLSWVTGRFEEYIVLTKNSSISHVPTVYWERQNHHETKPCSMDNGSSFLVPGLLGAAAGSAYGAKRLQAGIKSVYYESLGTAHEWLTWRRHLREFAPLIFKD